MKQELIEKLVVSLKSDSIKDIKEIIESKDFYFQRAIDKYNELIKLPKLGEEVTSGIINKVNELKNSNSFNYIKFLNEYNVDTIEYKVLFCIGELIAYIDFQAANKNELNKYNDKRTLARSYVRQNHWVIHLLGFKQSENVDGLVGVIKNAVKYLINPKDEIQILSERHRMLIGMFLFGNNSINNNFVEFISQEFSELKITVVNEMNRNLVYERLIYSANIRPLWEIEKTIWKVSHGNIPKFAGIVREEYLKQQIVLVEENTGKSQGSNFKTKMKVGDLFYLCFGGVVKLLGIITSEAEQHDKIDGTWLKRHYEIISEAKDEKKYNGDSLGWAPNYNSTCMAVKDEHLKVFEQELLEPYFGMKVDELFKKSIEMKIPAVITGSEDGDTVQDEDENFLDCSICFEELNYILYGPPGTGKTYNSINYAVAIIENKDPAVLKAEEYKEVKKRFDSYKVDKQLVFTTFHQSYGYEEFIEGIKPYIGEDKCVSYSLDSGIFKQLCERALKNKGKNYVIVIDEINRGNISKIFGELITLIEKTKRIGASEEITTTLPYSKIDFGVPKNIYLIGTMNTADRSIALLDTALRRRFEFIEMMPNSQILNKKNNNSDLIIDGINIGTMLDVINKRIEILYDREHTIGHAYFIDLVVNTNIDNLKLIFTRKILPLLQEYFYDDYEKIRLVLGDNGVKSEELQFFNVSGVPVNLFGNTRDFDIIEDKMVYTVNTLAFTKPEAYIKIYNLSFEEQ